MTPMTLRSTLALAAFVPALALARPVTAPPPATAPTAETVTGGLEAWNHIRVDLDLGGGTTLPTYISQLTDLTNGNFIVLSDPGVDPATIRLPPLRLRALPLGSAVDLLQELPGTDIKVEPDDNPATKVPTWRILVRVPDGGNPFAPAPAPVRTIHAAPASQPAAKPQTKLYPLGRMLFGTDATKPTSTTQPVKEDAQRVDQLLQLIDLTLTASADDDAHAPRAQINYHAPTRTLIVRAMPDQLAAIEQAINAFGPDPEDAKRASARDQLVQQADYVLLREESAAKLKSMEAQLAESRAELANAKGQLDAAVRSADRMSQAEADLARTRADLSDQKRRADDAVLRADRLAQALHDAKVSDPTTQP